MKIPLSTLPEKSRTKIRNAITWNLTPPRRGNGNRARRRAGMQVIDLTQNHPHGMTAGEKSKWLNPQKQ